MANLCVIPARGGSKRIPLKNIKDFLGKPIIAYSIEAAQRSGLFDEIMVATDHEEIAAIAKSVGAKIPFSRNRENASANAPLTDIINEVIIYYKDKGLHFDYTCCLLPTAPLITPQLIQKGYELISMKDYSSIRPVVPYTYPVQKAVVMDNAGYVKFVSPENYFIRSQDLAKTFHDSGTFYWLKKGYSLSDQNKKGAFEIAPVLAQDIDTLEDWEIAESKYEFLKKRNKI